MKNIKFYCFISILITLTGCESFLFDKTGTSVKSEIKNSSFYPEEAAAIYVESPDQYEEVKVENGPDWMSLPVQSINSSGGGSFHYLNSRVLSSNGINFIYADDIDPNTIINVNIHGRIKDALEDISHVSGYSYTVIGNTVNWSAYVTETFNVSYIPGDYSYMVGSTNQSANGNSENGSGGSGDTEQIEFGADGQEYSSVKTTDDNAFGEVEKVTQQIVGEFGSVAASRTTSSVIVTTTRARMSLVREYFKSVESKLGRQIAFEIKLLRFTSNTSGQAGIDWNVLKETASSSLEFNGGDLASITSGSPITFKGTKIGGLTDGSSALVSLLEQQGTVSIVNSPRVVTQPNRVVELELSDLQGYIARTEVTPSSSLTSSDPAVSMRQGIVKSGYRLYALANIGDKDKIVLHLSSTYIPKPILERKEILNSAIETPQMTRNRLVSTTVLKNGSTMILSGLQIEASNDTNESPFSARFLPTRKTKNSTTTETIALVTPIIVDMN